MEFKPRSAPGRRAMRTYRAWKVRHGSLEARPEEWWGERRLNEREYNAHCRRWHRFTDFLYSIAHRIPEDGSRPCTQRITMHLSLWRARTEKQGTQRERRTRPAVASMAVANVSMHRNREETRKIRRFAPVHTKLHYGSTPEAMCKEHRSNTGFEAHLTLNANEHFTVSSERTTRWSRMLLSRIHG